MSKSRRLDPLIQRAEERKSAVAKEFAAKTRSLAQNEQRLAELLRYSEEYAQVGAGSTTSPALLANREAFRGTLKQAVVLQQRAVEQSRQSTEFERTRLLIASRDAKVLDKLAANYRAEERRHAERVEQRAMDECAARGFHRKDDGGSQG